jgi:hypothetical protein
MKDIAKFSKVSYSSMKSIKNELIKEKWIIFTRNIGKAKMFKLNINNAKVSKFIDFYWSVIESETEKPQAADHIHSTTAAIPMSAKNF